MHLIKLVYCLRSSLATYYEKIIAHNEVGRAIASAVRNGINLADKTTIF